MRHADPDQQDRRGDEKGDAGITLQAHGQHGGDGTDHDPQRAEDERQAHVGAASRAGSPLAQAEIDPAPRQTTMSPGWACSRTSRARSASSSRARA